MNYNSPEILSLRKESYEFDKLCKEHQEIEDYLDKATSGKSNSADEELNINDYKKKKLMLREKIESFLEN